jgi:peptide/nickel transport system permease protein
MASASVLSPGDVSAANVAVAPPMGDIMPPVKARRGFWGFLYRNPSIAIGGAIVLAMVLMAVFAPLLTYADPTSLAPARRTREPSAQYWFGTDMLGRDVYSRVVYGARVSLIVGFSVAVCASIIGLTIGLISGFVRWADSIVMRVMDGMMSIPPILLAIALMALTRGSVGNVILAITIAEVPRVSRLVRGVVLSLREQPYVEAAVAAGAGHWRILRHHILPNAMAPMIVQLSFLFAYAVLSEATLSFLGVGAVPPTPTWGNIMAEGRDFMREAPWIITIPGVALMITVMGLNLLGDGLRDVLDPRLRIQQ